MIYMLKLLKQHDELSLLYIPLRAALLRLREQASALCLCSSEVDKVEAKPYTALLHFVG